jgi:hypothetical protein
MDFGERLSARLQARRLDRDLAAGVSAEGNVPMALRARALVRADTRRRLAAELRRVARYGVPPERDDLERLAARLLEPGPVDARGVALTQELLTDGTGPLFWADGREEKSARLRKALHALDPSAQDESQGGSK